MDNIQAQQTDFEDKLKEEVIELKKRMYNHPSLVKSIIEIHTIEPNQNSSTATGFLIERNNKLFVITNKHVIGDFSFNQDFPIYPTIELALRTKTDSIEFLSIPLIDVKKALRDNIKVHPRNFIDIAIMEISELVKSRWKDYDIEPLKFGQLKPFNLLSNYGISTGSPVIISGYPYGKKMEKNYPISCKLTMEPPIIGNDFLTLPTGTPDSIRQLVNSSAFKANGNAFKGMSGGPITILVDDYPMLKNIDHAVIGIFSVGTTASENDINHTKMHFLSRLISS